MLLSSVRLEGTGVVELPRTVVRFRVLIVFKVWDSTEGPAVIGDDDASVNFSCGVLFPNLRVSCDAKKQQGTC